MTSMPRPTPSHAPRRLAPAAGGALVLLIGLICLLDTVTGHELRLFPLYFLPVSIAAWRMGLRAGLGVAVLAALAWTLADVWSEHEYDVRAYQAFNALVQLFTFAFAAILVARIARALDAERVLSAQLTEEKSEIERYHNATTRELDLAAKVQRAILPSESPRVPGLDVAVRYRPAVQIGGDLLHIHRVDEGRTLFFLGDAMGHGAPAALVMSAVSAMLRRLLTVRPEPAWLLEALNAALLTDLPDQILTGVCCLVDVPAQSATIAVAGHAAPLWIRTPHATVEEGGRRQPGLGILADATYAEDRIALTPGDALVLYTDGLIDAPSQRVDPYGEERLHAYLERAAGGSASAIGSGLLADVLSHGRGQALEDDVALLVVRLPPVRG